jgi:ferritin-like metal-binding protein YciE
MNAFETGMTKLLFGQLSELYFCENQLVRALASMAEAASSPKLKKLFSDHRQQTIEHVRELERAFAELDRTPQAYPCRAIDGLLEDGKWKMHHMKGDPLLDIQLVAAAQKVEHFEIASYRSAIQLAQQIGLDAVAEVFRAILEEEEEADEKLSRILEVREAREA